MAGERYFQSGQGRVFIQPWAAGPGNAYQYQGCGRATGFSEELGDVTPVYCPSPDSYDDFEVADEIRGEGGLPTTSLVARFGLDNQIFKRKCPFGMQVHYGACQDPTDFTGGWDKIIAFVKARFTARSSDDLSALDEGERASILLTGDITAQSIQVIDPMVFGEEAASLISQEVVAVTVCDHMSCGDCGRISDGCGRIYAVTATSGLDSPGLPAEVVYTVDGGDSWEEEAITSMASSESPSGVVCAGNYLIVPSEDSGGYHYAPLSDLTDWTHVTGGFEDNPVAAFGLSSTQIWFVGDTGYIYFLDNVGSGVVVQSDGTAAGGSRLTSVFAANSRDVLAVGEDNTVVISENGGTTWRSVDGPTDNAGIDINTAWMRSKYSWLIGTAGGQMFYTLDAGDSWEEKAFPGSGSGEVTDIAFALSPDSPFGFMAHNLDTPEGRILRTLDGGNLWYIMPEGVGNVPANDQINSLAICNNPNFAVGGGLADDGEDGILVVGE